MADRADSGPLLVLGATAPVLDACERLGVAATVVHAPGETVDGASAVRGSAVAAAPGDLEAVLAALARAGHDPRQHAGVVTAREDALVTAAAIGELAGARALPVQTALRFRDKAVQKAAVARAGVRVPRFAVLDGDPRGAEAVARAFGYPAVVKPTSGTIAAGVEAVDDADAALAAHRAAGGSAVLMLEERVAGDEWHVSGVVADGRVAAFTVARYSRPAIAALAEDTWASLYFHPLDDRWAYELAGELADRALGALGLRAGVFHLEAFHPGGDALVFGECAARPPGLNLPAAVRRLLGVDLFEALVEAVRGQPPPLAPAPAHGGRPPAVATLDIEPRPGVLVAGPRAEDVLARPGVVDAQVFWTEPGTLGDDGGVYVPHARLLLAAEDRATVEARVAEVADWFRASVRVRDAP